MRFQEKMREYSKEELWREYCGFLDLSLSEYMTIQRRLLLEQMELWSSCALGQTFLKGRCPHTVEEFREMVPLTTYDDYAATLLSKQASDLPAEPVLWIQTTWEGGIHPLKVAPYTRSMLDTYKRNVMACFMMATSKCKGDFDISVTDHMLYALAPLPYATGLLPLLLKDEIDVDFLPPVKDAASMSFKERNIAGFKLGMRHGIEYVFGLGSVTYYVSHSLSALQKSAGGSSLASKLTSISPTRLLRYLSAMRKCKKEGRELLPRDLFQLKGIMCAGTDNNCYKDDLERLWGVRPMEIFAGTEPTCIGTETWSREGMYFFPDACFYEFIPPREMERSMADPTYQPRTVLMDEVVPGSTYEIVLTVFKGGAFARYLSDGGGTKALWNHDSSIVLGSTANSTLTLREDETGLWGSIEINEADTDALNAYARVARGDVEGCSFGFDIARQDEWWDDDGVYHTVIREVDPLYEVSPCTFPAYAATSIEARSAAEALAGAKAKRRAAWRAEMLKRLKGETQCLKP